MKDRPQLIGGIVTILFILCGVFVLWLDDYTHAAAALETDKFVRRFVASACSNSDFYQAHANASEISTIRQNRRFMSKSFGVLMMEDGGEWIGPPWQYVVYFSTGKLAYIDVGMRRGAIAWISMSEVQSLRRGEAIPVKLTGPHQSCG